VKSPGAADPASEATATSKPVVPPPLNVAGRQLKLVDVIHVEEAQTLTDSTEMVGLRSTGPKFIPVIMSEAAPVCAKFTNPIHGLTPMVDNRA
jgi:hypothetical protein